MSFLSIAFLAALPLMAAPILLHLFDRRRNVVIEWGAMQFLLEAATRRTSARKFKQWLLLLLRVCAVAALVLALSRPLLPGNWFGIAQRGETLFVIDNSMSMTRASGEGTLFDTAIDRAIDELDEIETGDAVRVLLASPYPVWGITGSLRYDAGSRKLIEDQLRELRPTAGGSDLLAALFTAVQTELQPTQQRRRIVVLTDGQASDWTLDEDDGWSRFRDVLQSADVPTQLDIVELDGTDADAANLAVRQVTSRHRVVGVDQPFALTAHVENFGRTASMPTTAQWRVGTNQLHESQIPGLDVAQGQDVHWQHSISQAGVYSISCSLDGDDLLMADNVATMVVEVVDQVPVVVLEGAGDLAEMQQDAFFVLAALGWVDGEPLDVRGVHVPTLIDPERLAHFDLSDQRAVVIPNFTDLDGDAIEQLEHFVESGGGLWIALGPRTDVELFNQHMYADGHGLAPLAIDAMTDEVPEPDARERSSTARSIDPFLEDHPATTELADSEQLDLQDVTITRRFRFVPAPDGESSSVLLSLNNGEPLAVEKYVGRGRVIVQAIPLRLQWSQLARSQAFVVMVQDWMNYLTEPLATRHNLLPGEPLLIQVSDAQIRGATLRTPHNDEIELTAENTEGGVQFRTSRTVLPGDYSLELGFSGEGIPFHVSRNPHESDLTSLDSDGRRQLADVAGLAQFTLSEPLSGTNQHEPIWPLLLMILIGLITAELLLSGVISRERFGGTPITETGGHWEPHADVATHRTRRSTTLADEAMHQNTTTPQTLEV